MNKQFDLLIDTKRTGFNSVRGLKQGDNNSVLNITLVQNSVPFDLNDLAVRINYRTPDNKIFLQMADVINPVEGKIKVNILTKVLESVGEIQADLSVFNKDNRKITSATFSMFADASVYKNDYIEPEDLDLIQQIYTKERERQENEIGRVQEESRRIQQEINRQELAKRWEIKEKERQSNETERQSNEDKRLKSEVERQENEKNRKINEQARQENETVRKQNESERIKNEELRKEQEDIRQIQEKSRQKTNTEMQSVIENISEVEPYNSSKKYKKLNRVTFNGSSYECLKDCTGIEPTNEEYWICIARKGKDGDGAGDMLKSIYDKNNNGIVDKAEEALSVEWGNVKNVNKYETLQQGSNLNDLIKPGLYIGQMLQNSPEEFNLNLIEVIKPDDMDIVMQRVSKLINHGVFTRVYKDGEWSKWTTYILSVNEVRPGVTGEVELKAEDIKTEDGQTVESELAHMTQQIENIDLSADKVTLDSTNLKSKTVKDGMEELFTFADNYKKTVANVVGSPVLATDNADETKVKIQSMKDSLVNILKELDKTVSSNGALQELIKKIYVEITTAPKTLPLTTSYLNFKPISKVETPEYDYFSDFIVDGKGGLYLLCNEILYKFNEEGKQQWVLDLNVNKVICVNNKFLIILCRNRDTSSSYFNIIFRKVTFDGKVKLLGSDEFKTDRASSVGRVAYNDDYVCYSYSGTKHSNYICCFSLSTGNVLFNKYMISEDIDYLAMDKDGDIYASFYLKGYLAKFSKYGSDIYNKRLDTYGNLECIFYNNFTENLYAIVSEHRIIKINLASGEFIDTPSPGVSCYYGLYLSKLHQYSKTINSLGITIFDIVNFSILKSFSSSEIAEKFGENLPKKIKSIRADDNGNIYLLCSNIIYKINLYYEQINE